MSEPRYLSLAEAKEFLSKGRDVFVSYRDDDEGLWLDGWKTCLLKEIDEQGTTYIGMSFWESVGGINYAYYLQHGHVTLWV